MTTLSAAPTGFDTASPAAAEVVAVRADGITRDFGNGRGIFDASVSVRYSTITGCIGPNGGGKSTLGRCLGLFERPDAGHIAIDGHVVSAATSESAALLRDRTLGCVFQQSVPWPHLSVLDNVLMPILRSGMEQGRAVDTARASLAEFELDSFSNAKPSTLSGGLRQRLTLARTLALKPRIVLLDEVTSALDPQWTEVVRGRLRAYADAGAAIIVISHQIGFVRRLADEVLFIHAGRVLSGEIRRLCSARPAQKSYAHSYLTRSPHDQPH